MQVKSESEVAQSYLTHSDPMDCSLPGSSVHGIFQVGVLEWGAKSSGFRVGVEPGQSFPDTISRQSEWLLSKSLQAINAG